MSKINPTNPNTSPNISSEACKKPVDFTNKKTYLKLYAKKESHPNVELKKVPLEPQDTVSISNEVASNTSLEPLGGYEPPKST